MNQYSFYDVLLSHSRDYPGMEPADYLKLARQCEYGGSHLLKDPDAAFAALKKETDEVEADHTLPFTVPLSGGHVRLQLAAVKGRLSPETVFGLMQADNTGEGSADGFERKLRLIGKSAAMGIIPADPASLEGCFSCRKGDISGHSDTFHEKYHPHYRIIPAECGAVIPALILIEEEMKKHPVTVAVEGRAGTGKTTFAALLHRLYGADVIHTDDYFLPRERKTPERLAQPGGNIDHERLYEEVISRLGEEALFVRRFDCRRQTLLPAARIGKGRLLVIEGVYALHPSFGDYADIPVFMDTDPVTQRERIAERGGEALLERYLQEWIPLEEAYFAGCAPGLRCRISIGT